VSISVLACNQQKTLSPEFMIKNTKFCLATDFMLEVMSSSTLIISVSENPGHLGQNVAKTKDRKLTGREHSGNVSACFYTDCQFLLRSVWIGKVRGILSFEWKGIVNVDLVWSIHLWETSRITWSHHGPSTSSRESTVTCGLNKWLAVLNTVLQT